MMADPDPEGDDSAPSVAADAQGHAILTWTSEHWNSTPHLAYAALSASGEVLTPATLLVTGQGWFPDLRTSYNGYGNTSSGTGQSIFMPGLFRSLSVYFEGPQENEPNNTAAQANGPLRSGRAYTGYPNDAYDVYSFHLSTAGKITLDLSSFTVPSGQLHLYAQTLSNRLAFDSSAPYHLEVNSSPGTYYVIVYTGGGFNSTTLYSLQAVYP
jgi:hypothetical protein